MIGCYQIRPEPAGPRHPLSGCVAVDKTADVAVSSFRIPNQVEDRLDPWFDTPFDRLTVLSVVEGLTILSKVERESSVFLIVMFLDAGRRSRL